MLVGSRTFCPETNKDRALSKCGKGHSLGSRRQRLLFSPLLQTSRLRPREGGYRKMK